MTRTTPTTMQWRCLLMLARHDTREAAAHAAGVTGWTFAYHLRELCRAQGFPSVHQALLYYADDIKGRRRRPHRRADVAPGQECMGLVA